MRAKFINEKFTQESDPIQDMNIGGIDLKDFHKKTILPAVKMWYDYLISFYGKNMTITDIGGIKHTFVLKDIQVMKIYPDDLISFATDLYFVSVDNISYKIDLSQRIFIHE